MTMTMEAPSEVEQLEARRDELVPELEEARVEAEAAQSRLVDGSGAAEAVSRAQDRVRVLEGAVATVQTRLEEAEAAEAAGRRRARGDELLERYRTEGRKQLAAVRAFAVTLAELGRLSAEIERAEGVRQGLLHGLIDVGRRKDAVDPERLGLSAWEREAEAFESAHRRELPGRTA